MINRDVIPISVTRWVNGRNFEKIPGQITLKKFVTVEVGYIISVFNSILTLPLDKILSNYV